MNDLNHVVLIGRLTQNAEVKYTQSGYAICSFSIAVNRSRKNGDQWVEEANFFEVSLFGNAGDKLKPYLTKGKQVAIDGELRQDRWESEGQKRSKVVIVANSVQLVGGNNGSNGQSAGGYATGPAQANPTYQQPVAPQQSYASGPVYGGDSGYPDDIPF